jgi:O-Antigen ligase
MAVSDNAVTLPHPYPATAFGQLRNAALVMLVVGGAVVGIASDEGGYFPTSWGLSSALLLWTCGVWLVLSGRTDAGRLDAAFLGLLAALTCWTGLSIEWSLVPAESVLELERALVPLAGVAALLVLARRRHVPQLVGVLLAAIALVSTYAVSTRLFPNRIGHYAPSHDERLLDPLGYWNTLGLFAVMGLLLAVGVFVGATSRWARAAGALCVVPLASALYFTFSRGSWLALALGLGLLLVITPGRLRMIGNVVVVGAPAALGLLLASHSFALTHGTAPVSDVASDGRRLAPVLLVLALGSAGLAVLLDVAEKRVSFPRGVRRALGAVLIACLLAAVASVLLHEGGPVKLAHRTWTSFSAPPPATGPDLDKRLFSFSGNGRVELWRAAWQEYRSHSVTGGGAGTFERVWQSNKDAAFKVRDAHSLYLETLAELGPVGLALLVALLAIPIGAGLVVRRQPMLPAALAAYVAFLIHAGVDWDWELSGVTLTALLIGCLALVAFRSRPERLVGGGLRVAGCAAVFLVSLAAIAGYLGNSALARAQGEIAARAYVDAVNDANRAHKLMPWSPWPLIARGDAQLAGGASAQAATSYRKAIDIDSREWRAWLQLGLATRGKTRAAALARARHLYPTSQEIAEAVALLENQTKG